jgi:hypothetical protein
MAKKASVTAAIAATAGVAESIGSTAVFEKQFDEVNAKVAEAKAELA